MRPIFIQEIDFTLTDSLSVSVPQHTSGAFFACLGCEDLPSRFGVDVLINGARTALPRTGRKVGNYAVVPVPNYALAAEGAVLLEFGPYALTLTVTAAPAPAGYSRQEEDADALHGALEALQGHPENLVRGTAFNDAMRYTLNGGRGTVYPADGVVEFNHSATGLTDYVDLSKSIDAATLEKGQTYTLSYEYKYDVAEKGTTNPLHGGELAVKFADGTTKWYGAKPALSSTGGKWVKWSATFTLAADLGEVTLVDLKFYQRDIKGACRFRNVKLSKGTFTGRWTMSQEDTDEVVASGTNLGWDYTKWRSGRAEAWKSYELPDFTPTTAYVNSYYKPIASTLPFEFAAVPRLWTTAVSELGLMTASPYIPGMTKTQVAFNLWDFAKNTCDVNVQLLVKGYWK